MMHSNQTGRVLKYHRADPLKRDPANDTVSVVFGCESGACLLRPLRPPAFVVCVTHEQAS
jgi:hypothetical protein